jgi:hypothetical protein
MDELRELLGGLPAWSLALMAVGGLALVGWGGWLLRARTGAPAPVDAITDWWDAPAAGGLTRRDAVRLSRRSTEQFRGLQTALRVRMDRWRQELDLRRDTTLQAIEVIRLSAMSIRLPQTMVELYQSLSALPRKPPEAQRADFEWHAQAGVTPLRPALWTDHRSGGQVEFAVEEHSFSLVRQTFALPSIGFDELTLFDADDVAVARVRVRLGQEYQQIEESAVVGCRPGAWTSVFAALRVRMDERRESLLIRTRYREVSRLRSDFGLEDRGSDPAAGEHR